MKRSLTRVCYVIPSLGLGGTEMQLIHLMRGLIRDHELTVVCTRTAGTLAAEARRLGAYVRELGLWSGWDFRTRRRAARAFRAHRPDVVHSFLFGFDLAVNRAAHDTGVPVVISSRRQLATWKKRRHVHVQRKANELVDCIVANSEAVMRFAIEQEGAPESLFRVIPNGIDADTFQREPDQREVRLRFDVPFHTKVVGMVANFSPVKDHALFLDVAAELLRRRPDVHFLLVGSGPLRAEVEAAIRQRGLADRFTRVSTIEEMPDLYALMAVSVLCSRAEGFPNTVIESMAAGTPVVAAAVGGVPELVRHEETGLLVATRNPADFADAIERVLDDEAARAMATRAAAFVREHLGMEKMVGAYRTLYAELLAAAHRKGR